MQKSVNPQLMIIDFAMPGTNGAEVVKAAWAAQPSLPILFVSVYADSAALEAAMGAAPFLKKPFRPPNWHQPSGVCTENPIRVYRLIESAKLAR
jgi:CheY-like chemotaxis protein